jgi:Predicted phosphoesterase (MutT family)
MMSIDKEIERLETMARDVLEMKKEYRQRRPIVIEFSGSPKSGKTSCVNSLAVFLKRNGFKVKVLDEWASVCPVEDKQNPMFNIWTSSRSIAGLMGVLGESKCDVDVLIMDRGIFDSLCWFRWLTNQDKMESSQEGRIGKYLTMNEVVKYIDIVFSFEANPEVSIEREYANLLTRKTGSIMNVDVLREYLKAIKSMSDECKHTFQKIIKIDTSNIEQNEASKRVTELTLESLKDMLMERIGYIEVSDELMKILPKDSGVVAFEDVKKYFSKVEFGRREEIENISKFIQPVPIAVISDKNKRRVFAVKKVPKAALPGSPERNKLLLYVGGHTRLEDNPGTEVCDFVDLCRSTLRREIKEELGVAMAFEKIEPFLIYTPSFSDKSKKHIGICFFKELSNIDKLSFKLDEKELIQKRGTSKSGKFHDVSDLSSNMDDYESWSVEILKYCFNLRAAQQLKINEFNE